jgi:hypothetical protein
MKNEDSSYIARTSTYGQGQYMYIAIILFTLCFKVLLNKLATLGWLFLSLWWLAERARWCAACAPSTDHRSEAASSRLVVEERVADCWLVQQQQPPITRKARRRDVRSQAAADSGA